MRGRAFLSLAGDPALSRLASLAGRAGLPVHLVGGTVRDLLLGRPPADLDVVVGGDPAPLAEALARETGGTAVSLDDAPPALRVVRPGVAPPAGVIDLTAYRAPTLDEDLALRDFTVNALAAPLGEVVAGREAPVLDPTGGLADLERRCLRMTAPRAFDDDPLRALRAHRLAAVLGFRLDPATARAAAARAPRLAGVAPERVAAETFRLLARPGVGPHVSALGRARLLEPALRLAGPPAAGWRAALGRLDALLADPGAAGRAVARAIEAARPDVPLAADRPRAALLRFALLAGREAPAAGERLRLAARETAFLRALGEVRAALERMDDLEAGDPARLVRALVAPHRDEAEALVLHAAAAPGPAAVRRRALEALATLASLVRPRLALPRPLTGDDLVRECGLAPGPAVGRLLGWLDEARAAGVVTDRPSALAFACSRVREAAGGER